MGKKKRELMISFGKISEEDPQWNIDFWQAASAEERFRAACELVRVAHRLKTGDEVPPSVDKNHIISGTYNSD